MKKWQFSTSPVPAGVKISQYGLRYIKLTIELMNKGELLPLLNLYQRKAIQFL
jgi:hypothetical protein